MTDLCPSCREPLDYPSGDGCAAMTLHKTCPRAMHHYGVFRRLLGCGAGEDEAMTRWGEIKCPRCEEADALVQAAVAAALREAINRVSGCDRISEVQPAILALIRERGE
jgi:LSD1 subclass zinc finger protein